MDYFIGISERRKQLEARERVAQNRQRAYALMAVEEHQRIKNALNGIITKTVANVFINRYDELVGIMFSDGSTLTFNTCEGGYVDVDNTQNGEVITIGLRESR